MNGKVNTRVEVFRRADKLFDFRVVAAENGNTLCSSSQGYAHEQDARKAAKRVVSAELHGPVYFTHISTGEPRMDTDPIEPEEPEEYAPEDPENGRDSAVDLPEDYKEPSDNPDLFPSAEDTDPEDA